MRPLLVIFILCYTVSLHAQNVGIGTSNPQQKLHVAGGVRIDGLAGFVGGIIVHDDNGDLSSLNAVDDTTLILRANRTWGRLSGTVPAGTVVASRFYNDADLKSRGFSLMGFIPGFTQYASGSANSPANTWRPTYVEGDPEKYAPPYFDGNKIFAWVDSVLYVYADQQFYIYNPVTDTWRHGGFNSSGFFASPESRSIYTGTELIVWGGNYTGASNNGFRYNVSTNTFTAIPTAGQPSAREGFCMQLINNRVVVWGGSSAGTVLNNGAVFNLATNTWSNITATGAPAARRDFSSVVNTTQNTLIVWGGNASSAILSPVNTGGIYNPVTNTWTAMTTVNAPSARYRNAFAWTGTELVVHGGKGFTPAEDYLNTGGRYNPATNTWTANSTAGAPGVEISAGIWTGTHVLVCGGMRPSFAVNNQYASDSWLYDPVANSWQYVGPMGVNKANHRLIAAGNMILAMGGSTSVQNAVSGNSTLYADTIHGSRYFLTAAPVAFTLMTNADKLYLYIKQ